MFTYLKNTERYNHDRNFGCSKEISLLGAIQNRFGRALAVSPGRFASYDYVCSSCVVELKTRRCKQDTYPDTMVGANKIEKMLLENRRTYCVFSYVDGELFVEITPDSVKQFRLSAGGRRDRGHNEQQMYYFIPVNLLCPLGSSGDM